MARFHILTIFLMVAACSDAVPPSVESPPRDPAIMQALWEPLMTDPQLVESSQAGSTLSGGGPVDGSLPLFKTDREEAAKAAATASALLGGRIAPAPGAMKRGDTSPVAKAATAAAVAAAAPFAAQCAPALQASFAWAARMPAAVPIYPRAMAQEAAGTDGAGCKLRVVRASTPVEAAAVVDFYYAVGLRAGFVLRHESAGGDAIVRGSRDGLAFTVYVRRRSDGFTEIDLVTLG